MTRAFQISGNRMETRNGLHLIRGAASPSVLTGIAITGNHHAGSGHGIFGDPILPVEHGLLVAGNNFPPTDHEP